VQKRKMPRDVNERAKLIIDLITGDAEPEIDPLPAKDPERVARGKLGGSKGGTIRAAKLTPERRQEIARKAAAARWSGRNNT
jgi:hypothetical protein